MFTTLMLLHHTNCISSIDNNTEYLTSPWIVWLRWALHRTSHTWMPRRWCFWYATRYSSLGDLLHISSQLSQYC